MEYARQTDEELIQAARRKDDLAFRELMRRYIRAIFNFTKQYTKSDAESEDITQDTFFKTWKNLRKFHSDKKFKPWLYSIARNTALDHIKRSHTINFSEIDNDDTDTQFVENLEDASPLQPEIFERAELRATIDIAMQGLHPDHRAIVVMRYHEELTFEEIANIINKPMNTVKSWHRRALIKIKDKLPKGILS